MSTPMIDRYSTLAHLPAVGTGERAPEWRTPGWVPADSRRRLAYAAAMRAQAAACGRLLDPNPTARAERREYGDFASFLRAIVDGATAGLGFTVEGSTPPAPMPQLPPVPDLDGLPDGQVGDALRTAIMNRWQADRDRAAEEWLTDLERHPYAAELQAWLDDALAQNLFDIRARAAVDAAVTTGDTVIVVTWDAAAGRPDIDVIDASSYFPELTAATDRVGMMPDRVHIAWEDTDPDGVDVVVRRTWELVDLTDPRVTPDQTWTIPLTGRYRLDTSPVLDPNSDHFDEGTLVRAYPGEPGRLTAVTCIQTTARWTKGSVTGSITEADLGSARTVTVTDLGLPTIPVFHLIGGTVDGSHWGVNPAAHAAQLFADLADLDTDIAKAGALAAVPAVATESAPPDGATELAVDPGALLWGVKSATVVDLTGGLDSLVASRDALLHRAHVVTGIPAEVLGRITSADSASGVAMLYAVAAYTQLIESIRALHAPVWRLMARHLIRLARANSALPPGPDLDVTVTYGPALPSDLAGLIERVTAAVTAGVMSRETAVGQLADAGVVDVDVAEEVARVDRRDSDLLASLMDVGGPAAAAPVAGITLDPNDDPDTPPVIQLP